MTTLFKLDHLAVAAADLASGSQWVADQLGVPLQPGGQHVQYGTHNMLLGLGPGLYLEVIARDPTAAPTGRPTWFGLDRFSGPPRLANWICSSTDLAGFASVAGPAVALSRGDLTWSITVPDDGSLPMGGGFPTLLQWGAGVRHPSATLPDSGLRLVRFDVIHPSAQSLAAQIPLDDPRVHFVEGSQGFKAIFEGPDGTRILT